VGHPIWGLVEILREWSAALPPEAAREFAKTTVSELSQLSMQLFDRGFVRNLDLVVARGIATNNDIIARKKTSPRHDLSPGPYGGNDILSDCTCNTSFAARIGQKTGLTLPVAKSAKVLSVDRQSHADQTILVAANLSVGARHVVQVTTIRRPDVSTRIPGCDGFLVFTSEALVVFLER